MVKEGKYYKNEYIPEICIHPCSSSEWLGNFVDMYLITEAPIARYLAHLRSFKHFENLMSPRCEGRGKVCSWSDCGRLWL